MIECAVSGSGAPLQCRTDAVTTDNIMAFLVNANVFDYVDEPTATCGGTVGVANTVWNVLRGLYGMPSVPLSGYTG